MCTWVNMIYVMGDNKMFGAGRHAHKSVKVF